LSCRKQNVLCRQAYKAALLELERQERLELLEGALVAMSPQHAPHAATIARLTKLLVRRVPDRSELELAVSEPMPAS